MKRSKTELVGPSIPFGILICSNYDSVYNWIERLRKHLGCNYFVVFLDTHGPALQYGFASWAVTDCSSGYYICR